jgi:hypothetical protein
MENQFINFNTLIPITPCNYTSTTPLPNEASQIVMNIIYRIVNNDLQKRKAKLLNK